MKTAKQVKVTFTNEDIENEDMIINIRTRQRTSIKMCDDILNDAVRIKKPVKYLVMNERMDCLANHFLAYCVDKQSLNDKGMNYIRKNEDLAAEVKDLLDGVKENLQKSFI